MSQVITYGVGGHCEDCNESHDHPLHNIVSVEEVPDPEPDPRIAILVGLGMTEEQAITILNL